jgi:hypothetical protein
LFTKYSKWLRKLLHLIDRQFRGQLNLLFGLTGEHLESVRPMIAQEAANAPQHTERLDHRAEMIVPQVIRLLSELPQDHGNLGPRLLGAADKPVLFRGPWRVSCFRSRSFSASARSNWLSNHSTRLGVPLTLDPYVHIHLTMAQAERIAPCLNNLCLLSSSLVNIVAARR